MSKAKEIMIYKDVLFMFEGAVQKPDTYSFFLEENIIISPGETALDLTTGSGFHAIMIAQTASKVVGIDVLSSAVECAARNVELNDLVEKVEIRQGYLFEGLLTNECFDLIVAWPPVMPTPKEKHRDDWFGVANEGGEDGRQIIDKIILNAGNYLNKGGRLQILHPWYTDFQKSISMLQELNFQAEITKEGYFPVGALSFERADYLKKIGFPLIEKDGQLMQHHAVITGWKLA